jgi:hypothetical protein
MLKRFCAPPLATTAAASPAKATTEPTERPMPAVRITNVMPTAIRPVMEICRITLNKFSDDRKRGSSTANTTMSATRNMTGANR